MACGMGACPKDFRYRMYRTRQCNTQSFPYVNGTDTFNLVEGES